MPHHTHYLSLLSKVTFLVTMLLVIFFIALSLSINLFVLLGACWLSVFPTTLAAPKRAGLLHPSV